MLSTLSRRSPKGEAGSLSVVVYPKRYLALKGLDILAQSNALSHIHKLAPTGPCHRSPGKRPVAAASLYLTYLQHPNISEQAGGFPAISRWLREERASPPDRNGKRIPSRRDGSTPRKQQAISWIRVAWPRLTFPCSTLPSLRDAIRIPDCTRWCRCAQPPANR